MQLSYECHLSSVLSLLLSFDAGLFDDNSGPSAIYALYLVSKIPVRVIGRRSGFDSEQRRSGYVTSLKSDCVSSRATGSGALLS